MSRQSHGAKNKYLLLGNMLGKTLIKMLINVQ